jgi:uncharacterized RDD family membrane protein YckC
MFVRGSAFALDLVVITILLLPLRSVLKSFLDIHILSSPKNILLLLKEGEISIASTIAAQGDALILMTGIAFLYFTIGEGSSLKTTVGKKFLLLQVSRQNFQPVGYFRASLRSVAKTLPAIPLLTVAFYGTFIWEKGIPGYSVVMQESDIVMTTVLFLSTCIFTILANATSFFSTSKLALHDMIARTIVTQHTALTFGGSALRVAFALSIIAVSLWALVIY